MLARISAYFSCTEDELWQRIIEPRSLQYVSAPILGFAPAEPGLLDGSWQKERVYRLMLYLLKFIPLGHHSIQLVKISKKAHTISSRESSMLARVWNHNICFREKHRASSNTPMRLTSALGG